MEDLRVARAIVAKCEKLMQDLMALHGDSSTTLYQHTQAHFTAWSAEVARLEALLG